MEFPRLTMQPGAPSFSRTLRKGWDSTAVSRMGFSEPHDLPFSSHFSSTALTDTESQSRNNSPTVQHRKLRPSPETDPKSAANHVGGVFENKGDKYTNKQQKRRPRTSPSARQIAETPAKSLFM